MGQVGGCLMGARPWLGNGYFLQRRGELCRRGQRSNRFLGWPAPAICCNVSGFSRGAHFLAERRWRRRSISSGDRTHANDRWRDRLQNRCGMGSELSVPGHCLRNNKTWSVMVSAVEKFWLRVRLLHLPVRVKRCNWVGEVLLVEQQP